MIVLVVKPFVYRGMELRPYYTIEMPEADALAAIAKGCAKSWEDVRAEG